MRLEKSVTKVNKSTEMLNITLKPIPFLHTDLHNTKKQARLNTPTLTCIYNVANSFSKLITVYHLKTIRFLNKLSLYRKIFSVIYLPSIKKLLPYLLGMSYQNRQRPDKVSLFYV
jgi:hypothetical protein